MNPHNK